MPKKRQLTINSNGFIISFIAILLLMPAVAIVIKNPTESLLQSIHRIFFSLLFFLVPVGFFYKNIKIYLYILIIWIVITPFFLFSIILFNQSPDAGLVVLATQTNKTEIAELVYGFKAMFAVLTILYTNSLFVRSTKSFT